jgi:hypothetical protein
MSVRLSVGRRGVGRERTKKAQAAGVAVQSCAGRPSVVISGGCSAVDADAAQAKLERFDEKWGQ